MELCWHLWFSFVSALVYKKVNAFHQPNIEFNQTQRRMHSLYKAVEIDRGTLIFSYDM